jgi:hypothetical protein
VGVCVYPVYSLQDTNSPRCSGAGAKPGLSFQATSAHTGAVVPDPHWQGRGRRPKPLPLPASPCSASPLPPPLKINVRIKTETGHGHLSNLDLPLPICN